ncbi:MAG: hypothetical protein FWC49_02075 [Proteobacteria bacterium]|nr:hypothetical protein [Pseudomonadota bacterium]
MVIDLLLEGWLEEPVADKLLAFCGHAKGEVFGKRGVRYIRDKAKGFYSVAAPDAPMLVLTDFMDTRAACPPAALQSYLLHACPLPVPYFLCRFAVNALESWLLADRQSMSDFLRVPLTKIPLNPDDEPNPKNTLIMLASRSRKTSIRDGIAPAPEHQGQTSPNYLHTMGAFVAVHWNVEGAMRHSPSLQRCVQRLQQL